MTEVRVGQLYISSFSGMRSTCYVLEILPGDRVCVLHETFGEQYYQARTIVQISTLLGWGKYYEQ